MSLQVWWNAVFYIAASTRHPDVDSLRIAETQRAQEYMVIPKALEGDSNIMNGSFAATNRVETASFSRSKGFLHDSAKVCISAMVS